MIVTVMCFSGRRNPTWRMTTEQEKQFRAILKGADLTIKGAERGPSFHILPSDVREKEMEIGPEHLLHEGNKKLFKWLIENSSNVPGGVLKSYTEELNR